MSTCEQRQQLFYQQIYQNEMLRPKAYLPGSFKYSISPERKNQLKDYARIPRQLSIET